MGAARVCPWILVLSEVAEFFYKCTDYYHSQSEISIAWDDPDLNINWPENVSPQLSDKDKAAVRLKDVDPQRLTRFEDKVD